MQRGQDAAARFGDRRPLDEQLLPDVIGLLRPGHFPELLVGQPGRRHDAKDLGDEIVIGDQLVDAPEHQSRGVGPACGVGHGRAEAGRIEMRVHIHHGLLCHGRLDRCRDVSAFENTARHVDSLLPLFLPGNGFDFQTELSWYGWYTNEQAIRRARIISA